MTMGAGAAEILDVRSLSVQVPTRRGLLKAVTDVSFTVAAGRTLCLVGESGSGKSLTALAVMGLLPPLARRSADSLRLEGIDLATLDRQWMRALRGSVMSMIFQEPMTALNPVFSVGDQIADVLRQHRSVSRTAARARALELLARVRLPEPERRLDQYPHQQSGGQRQRILIAMALVCGPRLLIADEPTTALDATVQLELLRLLADLQRDCGMGMLFITHDLGVVAHIGDELAVMYGGRIVEFGAASDVLAAPLHPYTRALMDCLPDGSRPRTALPVIDGVAGPVIGAPGGCAFRARCPQAMPRCATEEANQARPAGAGRYVRCLLPLRGGAGVTA